MQLSDQDVRLDGIVKTHEGFVAEVVVKHIGLSEKNEEYVPLSKADLKLLLAKIRLEELRVELQEEHSSFEDFRSKKDAETSRKNITKQGGTPISSVRLAM